LKNVIDFEFDFLNEHTNELTKQTSSQTFSVYNLKDFQNFDISGLEIYFQDSVEDSEKNLFRAPTEQQEGKNEIISSIERN